MDPVDTMAPWTIKAVSTEVRNKVTAAARQEGLTVGQWLEKRVNEWVSDGSPVVSQGLQPGRTVDLRDLAELLQAVVAAQEAGVRGAKTAASHTAAVVSLQLRQLRGLPAPPPKQIAREGQ